MIFGHEEIDYGFRVIHWFQFKDQRVAVGMAKKSQPPEEEIVETLVEAMIHLRVEQAKDRMPIVGEWRRFKKWRRKVVAAKRQRKLNDRLARVREEAAALGFVVRSPEPLFQEDDALVEGIPVRQPE